MLSVIYDDFYALQWFYCFHKKSYLFTFLPHFLPPKEIQLSRCDEFGLFISSNGLAAKLWCFDFSYFLRFIQVGRCFSSFSRCSQFTHHFLIRPIFSKEFIPKLFFLKEFFQNCLKFNLQNYDNDWQGTSSKCAVFERFLNSGYSFFLF